MSKMPFYFVFSCQKFDSAGFWCGFILFGNFFQLDFVGLCLLENLRSFHPLFTCSFVFFQPHLLSRILPGYKVSSFVIIPQSLTF